MTDKQIIIKEQLTERSNNAAKKTHTSTVNELKNVLLNKYIEHVNYVNI